MAAYKYVNQLKPGQVVRMASVASEFNFIASWMEQFVDGLFLVVSNGNGLPRSAVHLASGTMLEGPLAQGCQFFELANQFKDHALAFSSVGELLASLMTVNQSVEVLCGEGDVLCVELRRDGERQSLHFCDDTSFEASGGMPE